MFLCISIAVNLYTGNLCPKVRIILESEAESSSNLVLNPCDILDWSPYVFIYMYLALCPDAITLEYITAWDYVTSWRQVDCLVNFKHVKKWCLHFRLHWYLHNVCGVMKGIQLDMTPYFRAQTLSYCHKDRFIMIGPQLSVLARAQNSAWAGTGSLSNSPGIRSHGLKYGCSRGMLPVIIRNIEIQDQMWGLVEIIHMFSISNSKMYYNPIFCVHSAILCENSMCRSLSCWKVSVVKWSHWAAHLVIYSCPRRTFQPAIEN